jgi:LmbE family N-acetylglucosaminyl deacetylase
MNDPLKLLAILAHPDDEALGMGSTIAKYTAEGVQVYLICATKGERGWTGDEKDNPGESELGRIREKELLESAQTLGIKQVYFLGYIDGDLDQDDANEAMNKITRIIREVRPQVAITFGPDGAYGHPDHIAISQFAAGACVLASDSKYIDSGRLPAHRVSKFYFFVNSAKLADHYTRVFGNIQMEVDGATRSFVVWNDWMFTTIIDGSAHWRTALKAVNCHKSQVAIYGDLNKLSEERSVALWGTRTYYRLFSLVNSGRKLETDLFEGIR